MWKAKKHGKDHRIDVFHKNNKVSLYNAFLAEPDDRSKYPTGHPSLNTLFLTL